MQRAVEYSAKKRLPLTKITSNIERIINELDSLGKADSYRQTHSLRSAASASLLSPSLCRYVFSGSYDYRLASTAQTVDIAHVDAILMPLLSTDSFELISGASGMRRLDKTLMVADNADAQELLHVCVRRSGRLSSKKATRGRAEFINCSACWKCARTMFTFEIAGKLQRFSKVFDLEFFEANRNVIARKLKRKRANGDGQAVDALEFAETRGGIDGFLKRRLKERGATHDECAGK